MRRKSQSITVFDVLLFTATTLFSTNKNHHRTVKINLEKLFPMLLFVTRDTKMPLSAMGKGILVCR